MTISGIILKMIRFLDGNKRDINHFIKVWTYAKTIGELEGLDEETRLTLETAAVVHDISCPLCREKYGSADPRYQEAESAPLVYEFFKDTDVPKSRVDRVAELVSRHHTLTGIDGPDCQILIEADYIENADENGYPEEVIRNFTERIFRTESGKKLIKAVFTQD